ncbi:MAG TPA: hypothetical protein VK610_09450, partial [Rhodothermales bacterium]|nr:hypothetical protein [Rhodothermales bacterium]
MRLLLVLLRFALSCGVLGFAAAGAVAQPLPRTPEALKTVAARLHAAGFFNAAAHDDVRRQITAGRIDSRADLLSEAARALTPTGPSPGWLPTAEPDPAAIESGAFLDALLPNPDTLRASVGRLATTGAVSDRTHRRLVAFVDEVEAYADTLRTVLAQGGGISVYPGAHLPATLLHEIELLQLA